MKPNLAHPDRNTIKSLFNAIPARYDFLNSFFSLGLDGYWRRRLVSLALSERKSEIASVASLPRNDVPKGLRENATVIARRPKADEAIPSSRINARKSILDLGVGTGKSLLEFIKKDSYQYYVGCDFSENMLLKSKERIGDQAELLACDFHDLPFSDHAFDLVTGSFMLRSVQAMKIFLSEVGRVLKSNGRAIFLELTRPKNKLVWNLAYRPYLNFYIPAVGKIFSRHDHAYQFLSQSIQSFVDPADLKRDFEATGFQEVSYTSLSLGSATIIQGRKHE